MLIVVERFAQQNIRIESKAMQNAEPIDNKCWIHSNNNSNDNNVANAQKQASQQRQCHSFFMAYANASAYRFVQKEIRKINSLSMKFETIGVW